MDFIDDFYEEDDKGNVGADAIGARLNLGRRPNDKPLDVKAEFRGVTAMVHENEDNANYGEPYFLFNFLIKKHGKEDKQAPLIDEEYSIYIEGDKKTRKASAVRQEYKTMCEILSGITGESLDHYLRRGKDDVKAFINSGGQEFVGNEYRVYTTGDADDWKRFVVEAL